MLRNGTGFAALSASGPVSIGGGGFQWPTNSIVDTHEYLQSILNTVGEDDRIDTSNVLLCGFSQGALHAVILLANYPRFYKGSLAFSPGGWLELPDVVTQPELQRPLVLSYDVDEAPGTVETIHSCQRLWELAGLPLRVFEHEKGHDLPDDFDARFDDLISLWSAQL